MIRIIEEGTGVTFATNTPGNRSRFYNIGERELAEFLSSNNYAEVQQEVAVCGRISTKSSIRILEQKFGIPIGFKFNPSYNVTSGQNSIVIVNKGKGREGTLQSWGFPSPFGNDVLINARGETIDIKSMFADSFANRRCLVPVDGFYEWKTTETGRKSFFVELINSEPFAIAGIWNSYEQNGKSFDAYMIITVESSGIFANIHHRMPVILPKATWNTWLSLSTPVHQAKQLLVPCDSQYFCIHEIPQMQSVNNNNFVHV